MIKSYSPLPHPFTIVVIAALALICIVITALGTSLIPVGHDANVNDEVEILNTVHSVPPHYKGTGCDFIDGELGVITRLTIFPDVTKDGGTINAIEIQTPSCLGVLDEKSSSIRIIKK